LDTIKNPEHEVAISVLSLWELSMKIVAGKLTASWTPKNLSELATREAVDIVLLSIAHVERFHFLPLAHRDPFDKLLAAVALSDNYTFISPDSGFDSLGVKRLW
jgi:PIN domain nuclease of toxin-antitoxin system